MTSMMEIEEKMTDEWKRLNHQWQELSDQWQDNAQEIFKRTIWADFEEIVPRTIVEVNKLFDAIWQARREIP